VQSASKIKEIMEQEFDEIKARKKGNPTKRGYVQRFFQRNWTLGEAKAYLHGIRNMKPDNTALLELVKQGEQVE
jgi:hypothetical protein